MTEIIQPIPARLKNIAVGGHVAGADQIIDDQKNKTQETINSEVDTALENKANKSAMTVTPGTGANADKTTIQLKSGTSATVLTQHQDISGKADNTSLQAEVTRATNAENALDGRVDTLEEAVGTGGSVDSRISSAVATETTRAQGAESQLSSGKADKATTLAGYGITDAYTKSETYSKTEIHDQIHTPNQGYVTAIADSNTTTANLKSLIDTAAGSDKEKAEFIYRVGCWDGSQYNDTMYSEYAWINTDYIFLSKKSQIDEVFDISAYHANTPYVDLTAALGTNGQNIPQGLRKGGMSVKFIQGSVQSSDNKYVQFRYMSSSTAVTDFTNVANWQGIDVRIFGNSLYVGYKETNIKQDTRYVVDGGRNYDIPIEIGVDNKYIYRGGYIDTNGDYAISKPFTLKSGDILNISNILSLGSNIVVLSQKKNDARYYPIEYGNSDTSYSISIICDGEYYLCYKKATNPSVSVANNPTTLPSNVASSINEINAVIRDQSITKIVDGERIARYISRYGYIDENNDYIISRPYIFRKGDTIKITNLSIHDGNNVAALSLYKNNVYKAILLGDASISTYETTIEEDGIYYISYNFQGVTIPQIEIKEYLQLNEKQSEYERILIGEKSSFTQNAVADQVGKFIYSGGFVDSNGSYTISEPIPVKVGDIITISNIKKNDAIVALISSQIGDGTTRYNVILSGTKEQTEYTFINHTDRNIVLTYVHSYGLPTITITRISNRGLYTECRLKELYKCFSTCICVGDSVTHGVVDDYPHAYEQVVSAVAYPTQLAKITGWNITNAGKGGITAKGWFDNHFNSYTYTDYQVCLLEMCYNQEYTDTLDTDVVPYDDYNDYADTQTGNLCKIIKGILTLNPDIFIVLIASPRMAMDRPSSYEVYKKIADYYNLPLIDLTKGKYTDLNAECYHGTNSNGLYHLIHFNALGYMAKADVIAQMFNEAMLAVPRKSNNAIYG